MALCFKMESQTIFRKFCIFYTKIEENDDNFEAKFKIG